MKRYVIVVGIGLCLQSCFYQNKEKDLSFDEAQTIMHDVSQRNKAWETLKERDDSMMQQVVEFYKRKGTRNSLMEAYYLLGSVYRDLHDAPKAMEAFLAGIATADTTSADCRYDILIRLYGQKNDLLYKQKLFEQAATENTIIAHYATMAHDTLYAINALWTHLDMLYQYGDYISVADECWPLLQKSKEWGFYKYAAGQLIVCILANIEIGRIDDAQKLMKIYEQESGDVNMETMVSSFPIYYYTKGQLLLAQHKPDSAEIFFRCEMEEFDWNNRQAAYRGLCKVFEQTGQRDSSLKYALLQCEAVDSDYQEKLSENLQNLQQLYDYSRVQENNRQKELLLQKEQRHRLFLQWIFSLSLLALCFLLYYLYSRYQHKVAQAEIELERTNTTMAELEAEIASMHARMASLGDERKKGELAKRVEELENQEKTQRQEMMNKQEYLDSLRHRAFFHAKTLRQQYNDTPLFKHMLQLVKEQRIALPEDYEEIRLLLQRKDDKLLYRLKKTFPKLSETELNTILLLKIGLRKAEVARLTAHAESSISSILNRLYEKGTCQRPMNCAESLEWAIKL